MFQVNKERYKEVLKRILKDHYSDIKRKNVGSKERQQYIDRSKNPRRFHI